VDTGTATSTDSVTVLIGGSPLSRCRVDRVPSNRRIDAQTIQKVV
jgi:hypothetical protein